MALAWGGRPEAGEAPRATEGPACGGGPGIPGGAPEGGACLPRLDTWLAIGLLVFLGYGSLWIVLAEGRIDASTWEACNLVWLFPFHWDGLYPPLARWVASLAVPADGLAAMTSVRGVVLGTFAVGLALLYLLGTRAHSRAVGVLAGLMALSSPMLVAHSRMFVLEVFMLPTVSVVAYLFITRAVPFSTLGWSFAMGVFLGLNLLVKWSLPYYLGIYFLTVWVALAWRSGRTTGQKLLMLGAGVLLPLGLLLALLLLDPEALRHHASAARTSIFLVAALLFALGRLLQASQAPWARRLFPLSYLLGALSCALFVSSFYYFESMGTLVWYFKSQYANPDRANLNLPGLAAWSPQDWATALTLFVSDTVNVPFSFAFYRHPFLLWVLGLAWCLKDRDCRRRSALFLWMSPAALLGFGLLSGSESHYFLVPLFFSTIPASAGLVRLLEGLPPRARSMALHGLAFLLLGLAALNQAGFQHREYCSVARGKGGREFVRNIFRHDLYGSWEDLRGNPKTFIQQNFQRPPLDRSLPFWSLAPPGEDFLEDVLFGDPAPGAAENPHILLLFGCDTLVDVLQLYYVTAGIRGRTVAIEQRTDQFASRLAAADHDFLVICTDQEALAEELTALVKREHRYRLRVRKPPGPGQDFYVALYGRVRPVAQRGGPPQGAP